MESKKDKLKKSLHNATKAALDGLYSRKPSPKMGSKVREGFDPVDDVLDNDMKPETDPKKIPPLKTGVMTKNTNKNNKLENKNSKNRTNKLKDFLEKRKNKKKALKS